MQKVVSECIMDKELYDLWVARNPEILEVVEIEMKNLKIAAKKSKYYVEEDCGCCDNLSSFYPQWDYVENRYSFGYFVNLDLEDFE